MPSILSQREIDALLSALPVEDASPSSAMSADLARVGKPVKTYDFRHPSKFSRDQIRTLEFLHETFARRLQTALSAYLRTVVQINMLGVEQGVYDEYVRQVPSPAVLYPISMDPLPGRAALELHTNVVFIIVDRLLGGLGKGLNKGRELTDVEQTLLETVVWEVLSALKESWANIATLQPRLGEVAFTPQFMQIALSSETVLTISFEIRILDSAGTMRICIPENVLEPVMSQVTAQAFYAGSRRTLTQDQTTNLRRNLDRVRVPVVGELGQTELTLQELVNLRPGDVIPLRRRARDELEVLVAGVPKFWARPGLVGRRTALKVTNVIPQEEESGEEPG
ncbi:MAG TPA: flagellar motor switch protein FliM [Chloroflexota bacterium]|jgi:flagellar motor switch protein FliM|nr:flagellar motor switch protein FliM [Chloroflexota bacterium]